MEVNDESSTINHEGLETTAVELAYQSVSYPEHDGIADKDNFDWESPLVTN